MIENLRVALQSAFGSHLAAHIRDDKKLAIQIGNTELLLNEGGQSCGVSRVGAVGLKIDVHRFAGGPATAASAIKP